MASMHPLIDLSSSTQAGKEPCPPSNPLHLTEDTEEWEYEYDEQEKETYYVPLDLTPPVSKVNSARIPTNTDNQVQILGLHTPNPLISHRGQLFAAQWSHVIGSVLILHTPDLPPALPRLRTTPNYTLVASCAARITSRPASLAPPSSPDGGAGSREQPRRRIHTNPGASGARTAQRLFLERLQAVKDRRGEKDEVTIYAVRPDGGRVSTKKGVRRGRPRPKSPLVEERAWDGDGDGDVTMDDLKGGEVEDEDGGEDEDDRGQKGEGEEEDEVEEMIENVEMHKDESDVSMWEE
ncbi:MAG: hypothetical protein M1829_003540 [Trizodia sp. TS-e1964]|nr:MAG: hypothetical protein M1829_003540 [Trizodia sp. TS-e1964]